MIYSQRDETLPKALADAQRAASLAPGESRYQLQLAALLDRAGHPDEARKMAVSAKESATDRATADKAGELGARMSKPQPPPPRPPPPATRPQNRPPIPACASSAKRNRKRNRPRPRTAPPAPKTSRSRSRSSTFRRILQGLFDDGHDHGCELRGRTANTGYAESANDHHETSRGESGESIDQSPQARPPPRKGTTCSSLRGRTARISYLLVSGKPWDGEMQTWNFAASRKIELKFKQPVEGAASFVIFKGCGFRLTE